MANTPPNGMIFAIPDLSQSTNTLTVSGEPGTWSCVTASGTFLTTGSHFYYGDSTQFGSIACFSRIDLSSDPYTYFGTHDILGGARWQSRTGSNKYATDGSYAGSTSTTVSGKGTVLGEYVTITSPTGVILKAYSLSCGQFFGTSGAKGWVIAGSNDGGSTYTLVDEQTNVTTIEVSPYYSVFTTNNTISYTTYIIIITSMTRDSAANIINWNIYMNPVGQSSLACFVKGTRVLTPDGYKPVEELKENGLVMTSDGRAVPFKIYMSDYTVNQTSAPYLIEPHAFGDNKPSAPVRLSPIHKIQIREGVWVAPYMETATNQRVKQYGVGETIAYYHIECDDFFNDNLVTEDLVVESFGTFRSARVKHDVYSWDEDLNGFTRDRDKPLNP